MKKMAWVNMNSVLDSGYWILDTGYWNNLCLVKEKSLKFDNSLMDIE
jgi:hypothetical protein